MDVAARKKLTVRMKEATRELVVAVGGVARVRELTGASPGQISRWQGDGYPDLMPVWAIVILEFTAQSPIWARLIAEQTSHRLVPMGEDDGGIHAEGDLVSDLIDDMIGIAQSGAEVTSSLGEAVADRVFTPGEAKLSLVKIGRHEDRLTTTKRRLSAVAARAL